MNCFNLSWNLRKLCLCSIIQFLLSISRVNCKDKWKKLREGISCIDTLYVFLHVAIMTRERKKYVYTHRYSLKTWKLLMLLNLFYWKHIFRVRRLVANEFWSGVSPKNYSFFNRCAYRRYSLIFLLSIWRSIIDL